MHDVADMQQTCHLLDHASKHIIRIIDDMTKKKFTWITKKKKKKSQTHKGCHEYDFVGIGAVGRQVHNVFELFKVIVIALFLLLFIGLNSNNFPQLLIGLLVRDDIMT